MFTVSTYKPFFVCSTDFAFKVELGKDTSPEGHSLDMGSQDNMDQDRTQPFSWFRVLLSFPLVILLAAACFVAGPHHSDRYSIL